MIRDEVGALLVLGPFPEEKASTDEALLRSYEHDFQKVRAPLTDDEAIALTSLFGPDSSFGLAWTLLHLIETAPGWPLLDRLPRSDSWWVGFLRERAERGRTRER